MSEPMSGVQVFSRHLVDFAGASTGAVYAPSDPVSAAWASGASMSSVGPLYRLAPLTRRSILTRSVAAVAATLLSVTSIAHSPSPTEIANSVDPSTPVGGNTPNETDEAGDALGDQADQHEPPTYGWTRSDFKAQEAAQAFLESVYAHH